MSGQNYLNLGCGNRAHPDWINIDISPGPFIRIHDLRQGIPYADQAISVVYHSHFLEHLSQEDAIAFLKECHRVLIPGGLIRVVVPDLESIARLYLAALDKVLAGQPEWQHNYEWMLLELYDQAVRERPGGNWLTWMMQRPVPNEEFVAQRLGTNFTRQYLDAAKSDPQTASTVRNGAMIGLLRRLRCSVHLRRRFLRWVLGNRDADALELGRYRISGDVHKWMYDRYSLPLLLKKIGFIKPTQCTAFQSAIAGWEQYYLDFERDRSVYKADSLYFEAFRL